MATQISFHGPGLVLLPNGGRKDFPQGWSARLDQGGTLLLGVNHSTYNGDALDPKVAYAPGAWTSVESAS